MKRNDLLICAALCCLLIRPAFAQQREIKWNNPEGPKVAGVEHGTFHSESMDVDVGYNVALPVDYANEDKRYPVIYFLHGAGGNENSDVGFAQLVAKGTGEKDKQPPAVICVFPNGGMSGYRDRPDQKVMGETLIVKELIPLIDKNYRTLAKREGRIVAGFSMGGGGAVLLAFKHPDLFSAAGAWAAALGGRGGNNLSLELTADNFKKVDGQVRLLLVVGDKDMTFDGHKPFVQALEEAKYPFKYEVLEGVSHNLGAYHEKTGAEMVKFLTAGF